MTSLYDEISRQRDDPNDPLGESNFKGDPTKARDDLTRAMAERGTLLVKTPDVDEAVAAYYSWPLLRRSNFIGYMFPESVYNGGCMSKISWNEVQQSAANIMAWPASARSEFLIRISRVPERTA